MQLMIVKRCYEAKIEESEKAGRCATKAFRISTYTAYLTEINRFNRLKATVTWVFS